MSATAWSTYNKAKQKIGNGVILLGTNNFKIQLHTSASNASTFTLTASSELTNEVTNGNGYLTGGKALASVIWTVGASAKQYKFNSANPVWTASGGNIANIKFAVIRNSTSVGGGKVLCWSRLTTSQFTLSSTNTLTIQMNAAGIFTLA
jgi:hypothetical protein